MKLSLTKINLLLWVGLPAWSVIITVLGVSVGEKISDQKHYDAGYEAGHQSGFTEGEVSGKQEWYNTGWNAGYPRGSFDGYNLGYDRGKAQAKIIETTIYRYPNTYPYETYAKPLTKEQALALLGGFRASHERLLNWTFDSDPGFGIADKEFQKQLVEWYDQLIDYVGKE